MDSPYLEHRKRNTAACGKPPKLKDVGEESCCPCICIATMCKRTFIDICTARLVVAVVVAAIFVNPLLILFLSIVFPFLPVSSWPSRSHRQQKHLRPHVPLGKPINSAHKQQRRTKEIPEFGKKLLPREESNLGLPRTAGGCGENNCPFDRRGY